MNLFFVKKSTSEYRLVREQSSNKYIVNLIKKRFLFFKWEKWEIIYIF